MFVWAPDLKADLSVLAQRYAVHPELETDGLMRIAAAPPLDDDFVVSQIYDRLRPGWREQAAEPRAPTTPIPADLKARIAQMKAAPGIGAGRPPWDRRGEKPDDVLIERDVPIRQGKFRMVPAGVEFSRRGVDG